MSYSTVMPWSGAADGRDVCMLLGSFVLAGALLTQVVAGDDSSSDPKARSAAAADEEKSGTAVSADDRTTSRVPELVYLTWQRSKNADGKRALNQLWDRTGAIVPFEDAKRAILGTDSLNVHWWNPEESLRPLVLVYRVDPGFASRVTTTAIDDRGRRHGVGTFAAGKVRGWSVSAMAPFRRELSEWPKQISLEIKFPIEEARLLKTIDKLPEGKVQVAEGLEWSIEDNRGLGDRKPAAVLRSEYGQGDWERHSYEVKCYLRGKKEPLAEGYATRVDDAKTKKAYELRVSTSIENRRDVERVEIWRQRNDTRRFDDVPLRLDLQPNPDPSEE